MVSLAVVAAVSVPLGGCNAFGDDVAASVNGHDISINDVRELAAARAQEASSDDTLDATAARGALAELIQLQVFRAELKRRGGAASASDRSTAEQLVGDLKGLRPGLKSELLALYADRSALLSKLEVTNDVATPTPAEIRARAAELLSKVPAEQLTVPCALGVFGPTEDAEGVQVLVDGGTDVGDAAKFSAVGFRPIGANGEPYCGQVGEPRIDEAIGGPVGTVRRVDFQSQQGPQTVFLRPTGMKTYTADDPEVLAEAQSQLEQEAQQAAQLERNTLQVKQEREIYARARIDVDPRFGTFDPVEIVAAPPAPHSPTSSRG